MICFNIYTTEKAQKRGHLRIDLNFLITQKDLNFIFNAKTLYFHKITSKSKNQTYIINTKKNWLNLKKKLVLNYCFKL